MSDIHATLVFFTHYKGRMYAAPTHKKRGAFAPPLTYTSVPSFRIERYAS